jgi:hypothetical protein
LAAAVALGVSSHVVSLVSSSSIRLW